MATFIFPSVNDIYGAGSVGDGVTITEENLKNLASSVGNNSANYVSSGYTLINPIGLDIQASSGYACIDGYYVRDTASLASITVGASTTTYVFLQLTVDGSGNVTGTQLTSNTSGATPARSVFLGSVVSDVSTITSNRTDEAYNGGLSYCVTNTIVDTAIATATSTAIPFATANVADTQGFHDILTNNTRLTMPQNVEIIELFAMVAFLANTTGRRRAFFRHNGGGLYKPGWWIEHNNCDASEPTFLPLRSGPIAVSVGDYFELMAYQNSGGNLGIDATYTYFGCKVLQFRA